MNMEAAMLSFDKRKHPRVQVSIPVQYKVINQTEEALTVVAMEQKKNLLVGKSKDVSAEGLYLMSERHLQRGDILKLEVLLPHENRPLRAFSEVVWTTNDPAGGRFGAGIYFMALRDEDADRLGRFVAESLAVEHEDGAAPA